jgi:hypothetical protein
MENKLRKLIREEIRKALKEIEEMPEDDILTQLRKSMKPYITGNKGPVDVKIIDKRKGHNGEEKTITMGQDEKGNVKVMDEGLKDKLMVGIVCTILASGLVSCTKPNDSDLRPNNAQTEIPSGEEENVAPVDFLNTTGKTVTMNSVLAGLGKYTPKPKTTKGDTTQYKQQIMKPGVKMELADSAVARNDAPWIGYWKFTDKCRSDNQQVMIWAQSGDDPWASSIYLGYQLPDNDNTYSSAVYKVLADGKRYIISKYSVKYWNWQPNYKNADPSEAFGGRLTVVISSPEVDSGANRPLDIDFIDGGKQLKISSWGAGHATRVNGLSDFKW